MNREIEARLKLSAIDKTGKAFGQVGKRFGEIDKRAAAYNKRQSSVARTTQMVNREMLAFAGRVAGPAAIAYGLKQSVTAAASFEEALFNIEKKSGASAEQMEKMRNEIKALGQEVPVNLDEIASAFERGAAAGIPLEDLKEFARLSVQVSDAWDMSAEAVGNTFAGFTAGLGLQQSELENYADLINFLADSGIADESGIADFIDRVGASLTNMGFSPQEIAAYGAALQNLKMPAEIAARAMDTLGGKLSAPENLSPKSRTALQKIVGDLTEFKKVMAEGGSGGLIKFFENLEKMTGQQRISLLGALMGEGFDDEVARMVGGLKEIKRNLGMVTDKSKYEGSIAGLSEKRLDLFNSKLQLMKNNFEQIGISIGNDLIEPLGKATNAMSQFLNDRDAFRAGQEKAKLPGQSNLDVMKDYMQRNRAVHPDQNGWERGEAYRNDMRQLGRGDIESLFSNIIEAEANKRLAAMEKAARGDGSYVYGQSADSNLPKPGERPRDLSLAEQYGLYGAGQDKNAYGQEFVGAVGQQNDYADKLGYGDGSASLQNVASDFADKLGYGSEKLKTDAETAGKNVANGGEQAAASITAAGNEFAAAVRAASTAMQRVTQNAQLASGNRGQSFPWAGVVEE